VTTPLHRFMSHAHVAAMNDLLEGELLEECAGLTGDHVLQYDITDDPEGIRHWTVIVNRQGLRFALDQPVKDPVAVMRCSYTEMVASILAARAGESTGDVESDHAIFDPAGYAIVKGIIELSRPIATIESELPSQE
jgi:hypothetical protein